MSLKSQDILIMFKALSWSKDEWTIRQMASAVYMSVSETHQGLKRLEASMLLNPVNRAPLADSIMEFVFYGLKYVYPVKEGPLTRGIPTAHTAPPLDQLIASDMTYIWPYEKGNIRGISIEPLYSSVPRAVLSDNYLYQLLALTDALRIGRRREISLAEKQLKELIDGRK